MVIRRSEWKIIQYNGNIYTNASETAKEFGQPGDLVFGANIAGFRKAADAMIDQGLCKYQAIVNAYLVVFLRSARSEFINKISVESPVKLMAIHLTISSFFMKLVSSCKASVTSRFTRNLTMFKVLLLIRILFQEIRRKQIHVF